MILSTLVIEKKDSLRYLPASIFCLLFAVIYEHFSYGEYSWAMRLMFLFPLIGGVGLNRFLQGKRIKVWSLRFWASGLAIFTLGCLVHGIIVISGRTCGYDWAYIAAGLLFLFLGIFVEYKKF